MDKETVLHRIDELLRFDFTNDAVVRINECFQSAVNLLNLVHGPDSAQLRALMSALGSASDSTYERESNLHTIVMPAAMGTLRTLRSEVENGLVGNMERRGAGAALSDFLGLARGFSVPLTTDSRYHAAESAGRARRARSAAVAWAGYGFTPLAIAEAM